MRYTEMKDSGVKWIGEIPKHWKKSKIKYCASFMPPCDMSSLDEESKVTFTPMECIKNGFFENRESTLKTIKGSYTQYQDGDIVIAKVTPCFENGNIAIMHNLYSGFGFGSSELFVLRPHNIHTSFLFYSLQSNSFIQAGKASMTGTGGLKRVSSYTVVNYPLFLPPFAEQEAIAAYLDEKCTAIDEIIQQAKATIEEYKAWKASVIFEAVTKGLDPNAEMKNSGVEWIGLIPKHWERIKFKYLLKIKSGDAIRNETLTDSGLCPVYGGGELIGYSDNYNVEGNTILIGRVGARCGCITKIPVKAWATDNALVVTTKSNLDYVFYLLSAANLNKLNTSNAQPLITSTKISNCFTAFTSDNQEQSAIVDYLDKKCAAIDTVIAEKQALIDELETYKKSLIFETVTGKRRVC